MKFDPQPRLTGDLLELRPLVPADWDALYAVASDPLIWAQHPVSDRWREPMFRTFFDEALASGGALAALDRADGKMIGSSRFHGYDPQRREVEIGWTFLARSRWGGVHNGEMKRLMLDHAFRFVDSVLFLVGPGNRRSQRAVGKVGGRLEGSTERSGRESLVFRLRAADRAGRAAAAAE
jgi:RimJ/RimL family protein N-acetyltransferase